MRLKENLIAWEKTLKNKKIFSVTIEKEVSRTGKNGEEIIKTISYKLKFIANFLITNLLLVNMYLLAALRISVRINRKNSKQKHCYQDGFSHI